MTRTRTSVFAGLATLAALVWALPAVAQSGAPESVVSIYRAAPGQQEQLLRWFAQQDEASRAVGIAPAQLYVHQDGASWDFVLIAPQTTDAQDREIEAATRRMGRRTGPRVGMELRKHIAEHSDTIAIGPTTAADWLRRLGN